MTHAEFMREVEASRARTVPLLEAAQAELDEWEKARGNWRVDLKGNPVKGRKNGAVVPRRAHPAKSPGTCSTEGCSRRVLAKGLCHRCYDAERRGRGVTPRCACGCGRKVYRTQASAQRGGLTWECYDRLHDSERNAKRREKYARSRSAAA